jgi:predicted alpha/beta hydrolase
MQITQQHFETTCNDGVTLKGILLIPEKPKAVIQFNAGTATKIAFYLPFLNYLAQHNYLCCLWNYRGSGASAPESLRHSNITYSDYGTKDMDAIKAYLQQQYPTLPFFIVGHSTGGQQVGFMKNLDKVTGMIGIAVSTGYPKHMPLHYKPQYYFFFNLFAPISILLTGYVAAKSFNIMENLPKYVVKEWHQWCSKENYFFDSAFMGKTVPIGHFKNMPFPVHYYWTTDDNISNEKNTFNYWKHIKSTYPVTYTKLEPLALGLRTINHFGFFKKHMQPLFWVKVLAQLNYYLEEA